MSTIQWARKCKIEVKLPYSWGRMLGRMSVAKKHFAFEKNLSNYEGSGLVNFARHRYTNYETLLDECSLDAESYQIVKRRCNDAIVAAMFDAWGDNEQFVRYCEKRHIKRVEI